MLWAHIRILMRRGDSNEYPQPVFEEISWRGDSNEYPQHVFEEILISTHNVRFYGELSKIISYLQIPTLSIPLISNND